MNPVGLLAAWSVLHIIPSSARGKPLEHWSSRESPETSRNEEDDLRFDLSSFLDNMKEDFLRSLNLSDVPSHERTRLEPPQFMIDLYNRYASDKSSIPASNIVRSFNMEDAASLTSPEDPFERHVLLFNVSVPRHEEVTRAELRLHVSSHQDTEVFLGWTGHLAVYDILDGDVLETSKVAKSFLVSKKIHRRGWEMFEITSAVKRWVRADKMKNRLEVALEHDANPEPGSPGKRIFHLSTNSRNMPILIVFSDDRSSGAKETKLELREMIGHEQETAINKLSKNSTGSEEEEMEDKPFSVTGAHPSSSRSKRSIGSNNCRKTSLRVNFKDIGWDSWIIAPKDYDAFECKGMCYFPLTDDVTPTKHAIVQTLMHLQNPKKASKACCVPTKLDSISILYTDDAGVPTLKRHYEGMKVAECGCR